MAQFQAHKTCDVEEGAVIGAGTKIWHYSHVMKGCQIGEKCILGQNVYVGPTVKIGNRVKIQNNVSVYDSVVIEDDVFCGPSMVFTNVINPRAHIERKDEFKPTLVKKGVTIGANATIVCGITLGEFSFVGAGSVVTKDVPAYALVFGNPAKQQGWMCQCGVRLVKSEQKKSLLDHLACKACKAKYKVQGKTLKPE